MMRTRREQVQAYRFVTRRIVSALLSGEPETNNLPMRRLGMALFGSVMVGTIVLAVIGAYGLLTNRKAPLKADTLVIERETGAKYVYLDNRLYPVLNYASARLVLNTADPETRTMSQGSLKGYPRGLPVGIPNAPDALPEPSALVGLPWRVCSSPGTTEPTTHIVIGRDLSGAVSPGDHPLIVALGKFDYVLWEGRRLRIVDRETRVGLGVSAEHPVPVGEPFLNALPAGSDLSTVKIPGLRERSTLDLGEAAYVGDVYQVAGQNYILTREGLVAVGELTAQLAIARGASVKELTAQVASRNLSYQQLEPEGFPQRLPRMHPGFTKESTVCASYRSGSAQPSLELFDKTPAVFESSTDAGVDVRETERDSVRSVDRVVIEGGRGALVQAGSPAGTAVPGSTVYLITDQGLKFPLGTAAGDARTALGYGEVAPTAVPAALLALVPTGPTLDTGAARRFVTAGTTANPAAPAPPAPTATPAAAGTGTSGRTTRSPSTVTSGSPGAGSAS